jgi:hypothetical protein
MFESISIKVAVVIFVAFGIVASIPRWIARAAVAYVTTDPDGAYVD